MDAPPRFKQLQRQLDVHRARGARFKQLVADANSGIRSGHTVVEPINDHRAVIGGGEHESKLASDIAHEVLPGGRKAGNAAHNHAHERKGAARNESHPLG
jgi:hypothetical protein